MWGGGSVEDPVWHGFRGNGACWIRMLDHGAGKNMEGTEISLGFQRGKSQIGSLHRRL